jgi:hypothetical protein
MRISVDLGIKCINLTNGNKDMAIEAVPTTRLSLITMSDDVFNKLKTDEVTQGCTSTLGNSTNWDFDTEAAKRYTFVCEVENPLRKSKSVILFDNVPCEFIILPHLSLLDNVMGSGRLRLNGCYSINNYIPGDTNVTVGKSFSIDNVALKMFPDLAGPVKFETTALLLNGLFHLPDDNEIVYKYNDYNIRRTITRCCIFYKMGKVGDIFKDYDKHMFTVKTLDQTHPDKYGLLNNCQVVGKEIENKTLYFTLG